MSMEQVPWDLEERVEDAIVAHIKTLCTEIAMVIAERTITEVAYPLVVVAVESSNNHSDTGRITGRRDMTVSVNIVTEALNYNGSTGGEEVLRTAREHHRVIKSSVIGALSGNNLHTILNDEGQEGVAFSQAYVGEQTRDAGDGKIITIQNLDVIAQPQELY